MNERLFLSLLVTLCGGMLGVEHRRRMLIRVRSLKLIQALFRQIGSYAAHTNLGLNDIAEVLLSRGGGSSFSPILSENNSRLPFAEFFLGHLRRSQKMLCLNDGDIAAISTLVAHLGALNLDDLLSRLDLAEKELASLIGSASAKADSDGKISLVLGFSSGAVAALLLL